MKRKATACRQSFSNKRRNSQ